MCGANWRGRDWPLPPGRPARELLAAFLQVWPVEARARCVERLGWHGGVYVVPAASIGEAGERVIFQIRSSRRRRSRSRPYATARGSSFLRTVNRFTSAQVANSRWAFFLSPR